MKKIEGIKLPFLEGEILTCLLSLKKRFGSPGLALILASLVALLAAGCGSSSNDFVYTGPQAGSGSFLFHFNRPVQAQAASVPADTVKLGFKFFAADDSVVLDVAPQDYADQIQIDNVPATAVRVQITAYGAGDQALGYFATPLTVSLGQVVEVDLSQVPFTPVTPTGQGQLIVEPESITIAPAMIYEGGYSALKAYYVAPNSTTRVDVSGQCGVSFSGLNPSTVDPASFRSAQYGPILMVGITPDGNAVPLGTKGVITVTYLKDGAALTDSVNFTVAQPKLTGVTIEAGSNGNLTLPQNTAYGGFPLLIMAHYDNGTSLPIGSNDDTYFHYGNHFEVSLQNEGSGVTLNDDYEYDYGYDYDDDYYGYSLWVASNAPLGANNVVNVYANGSETASASLNVTVTGATVTDVILAPSSLTLDPGGSYTVTLVYSDNSTQDVTKLWPIDVTEGTGDAVTSPYSYGGLAGLVFGTILGEATLALDDGGDVSDELLSSLGLTGTNGDTTNDEAALTITSTLPFYED